MKIISSKEYKRLKEIERKYDLLVGQTVTFWTGQKSRVKALLTLEKEELVRRLMDLNNTACQLRKKKVSNMIIKQDKCLNCGASINYNKVKNNAYQCPYCREYYHIDELGLIEEYKVKLKYMGRIIHCYLGSMKCEYSPQIDTYRTATGEVFVERCDEPQFTFELVSYKIEDKKESEVN